MSDGRRVECAFDTAAVGAPALAVRLPAARSYRLSVEWHGRSPSPAPEQRSYRLGEMLQLPAGIRLSQIDDPQKSLTGGHIVAAGFHTVFASVRQGDCGWSMPILFKARAETPSFVAVPSMAADVPGEQVDLSSVLNHQVTGIFTRVYAKR